MKKLSFSLLAALMLLNFAGCKKDEAPKAEEPKPEAAAEAPKDYCSTVTVDSLKALVKTVDKNNKKVLEDDSFASILEALQCCQIEEKNFALDRKNCVAEDALKAIREDKVLFPALSNVASKLAKHESPIVRGRAYAAFSGLFGASDKDISIAKDAIKNEKDPYALRELVKGLSNEGNKDPEVGKFLLDMSKHENKFVRRAAADALANSWSDKVEGAVDTVIALMSDEDENVAKLACAGAGKLGDEKVIEPIVKILNDESKVKMHSDCMSGLSTLWLDFPFHEKHSENAYKAAMDYLKKTPRTKDIPSWSSVSTFSTVATTGDSFKKWKKDATWFKYDEFKAVMLDLIKDDNFNWLGKSPAFKAIASFGGKAELESIQSVVDGLSDQKVKDSYKQALDNAK